MTTPILGVLAIWLLAVVSPGPAFLVLGRMAAGRSRAAAFGTALGIATCALLFAALTLWGLAIVVTRVSWVGYALRIAGAIYLVYLGICLLRSSGGAASLEGATPAAGDLRHGFRVGFLTGLTNPKAIAFFLSLFAVALPPDLGPADKLTLLAAGFGIELGWYALVAFALSGRAMRAAYARMRKAIDRVLGSALVILGVRIGATH
jgi:threonine/homoserine/homoserine lactone efflux protein